MKIDKRTVIKNLLTEFINGEKFHYDSNNMQNIEDHLDRLIGLSESLNAADAQNPAVKKLTADLGQLRGNFSFALEEDEECTRGYGELEGGTLSAAEISYLRDELSEREKNVRSYLSEIKTALVQAKKSVETIALQYKSPDTVNAKD